MTARIYESHIKEPALEWFGKLDWSILHDLGSAIGDHQ